MNDILMTDQAIDHVTERTGFPTDNAHKKTQHDALRIKPPESAKENNSGLSKTMPTSTREVQYDSDVDPDELLPVYLETKAKLFHLLPSTGSTNDNGAPRVSQKQKKSRGNDQIRGPSSADRPEIERLQRRLVKIENDILFDQYVADQQWVTKHIQLEKDAAAARKAAMSTSETTKAEFSNIENDLEEKLAEDSDNGVSREAAEIGIAMLEDGSDDDEMLADLFASLPVTELDPLTGKSITVVNSNDGIKTTIRDFGKWSGVGPKRIFEEACRAR